ncbi:TlpA family protein disulfide reductase [Pedobacter sp. UBA5917]|uniref:TlpA family protein disulfide reductase n=1 Tax=Pedobacter sp. UBA5917 TaxID=1947061 RepID=UPI0025FBEAC4|nr:TlpA disulfide reductase family protein [Pedobacter sp. UBA5917]
MADTTTIVSGIAKLTGRITIANDADKNNIFVNVTVPHQISGEFVKYQARVDQSGKFSLNIDVETNISLIRFSTSLNPQKPLLVRLKSGGVTHLDIAYNSEFNIENITVKPGMNRNDMTRHIDLMGKMITYVPSRPMEPLYNKSIDHFLNSSKTLLSEILLVVKNDTLISNELKEELYNDFSLFFYKGAVFDYHNAMMANYSRTNGDKNKKPDIQKIDRSYYRFLADLKLDNPKNLQAFTFLEFQKKMLQNEILAIPPIDEIDIPTWLTAAKTILSGLIGFNNGTYYDILAANAYGEQLTEEVRPLTAKQKENILSYWGNGEIAKILLHKNQQVTELDKFRSPLVINDVSSIAADKIIETIVSKHKDKVILIDLWATWCGPCLEAMQRFRPAKAEFHGKDVVFVYLTNHSSPQKLWQEKIKGIGNEQYYLDDKQWKYVMNRFEFEYIPSYLLYNKKGELTTKFSAFPENEVIKSMINKLLSLPQSD